MSLHRIGGTRPDRVVKGPRAWVCLQVSLVRVSLVRVCPGRRLRGGACRKAFEAQAPRAFGTRHPDREASGLESAAGARHRAATTTLELYVVTTKFVHRRPTNHGTRVLVEPRASDD